MKIVQALEDFNILLKGVTKIIKNETKEQKGRFLGMLSRTSGAGLLGNILREKGMLRTGYGSKQISDSSSSFDKLWNSKIFTNEPRFNVGFSRDNLANKIKDGAYVINRDENADTGTHWIALFCTNIEVIYFDSFGVEHISKKTENVIEHKNIKTVICRI